MNTETGTRGRGRKLLIVLLAMVLFLWLGHLSNLVSINACEREVFRHFHTKVFRNKPLKFSEKNPPDWHLERRLRQADVEYVILPEEEYRKNPFPSCRHKPASPICPFVVAMPFEYARGDLAGVGGRAYVINCFGFCVFVFLQGDWVS